MRKLILVGVNGAQDEVFVLGDNMELIKPEGDAVEVLIVNEDGSFDIEKISSRQDREVRFEGFNGLIRQIGIGRVFKATQNGLEMIEKIDDVNPKRFINIIK